MISRRMNKVLIFLVVMCLSAAGFADVIFVDKDAPGTQTGNSWTNAFTDLQAAIDSASLGDEIRIAEGIYTPMSANGDPRDATFLIQKPVVIKGGYAGYGQPLPNHRDTQTQVTTLSGDLVGNDSPVTILNWTEAGALLDDPTRQDNCYSVITMDEVDANTVLDGVTVYGGVANGSPSFPYPGVRGGGLFCMNSSPVLNDCVFSQNAAEFGGGGVYLYQGTDAVAFAQDGFDAVVLSHCVVSENYAGERAGGLYTQNAKVVIEDSAFSANYGDRNAEGGGIHSHSSQVTLIRDTFSQNFARLGGGLYVRESQLFSDGSWFIENISRFDGGAIMHIGQSEVRLKHSSFIANRTGSGDGGAVYTYDGMLTVDNCLFNGNAAGRYGGALSYREGHSDVTNCTFVHDVADEGRSIATVVDGNSVVEVTNCILWDPDSVIRRTGNSRVAVSYSDQWNTVLGLVSQGAMQVDPGFVDPNGPDGIPGTLDDNLRLAPGSPLIDAGQNRIVPEDIVVDLDGTPRFLDDPQTPDLYGEGDPPVVDIGAYEYEEYMPGPATPFANAGPDLFAFAGLNLIANVQLDGSGSSDPDEGDKLFYTWTWNTGLGAGMAEGPNPIIQLPVGVHIVTLRVSDGAHTSGPDQVQVTVVGPFEGKLEISPNLIDRQDSQVQFVTAILELNDIAANELDMSVPFVLTPGEVPALSQFATDEEIDDVFHTTVVSLFSKQAIVDAIETNGGIVVEVSGLMLSGQGVSGKDGITLIGDMPSDVNAPIPNPAQWALIDPNADPNDPNDPGHYPGEPRAVLVDPRAEDGVSYAIAMRALAAVDPFGGVVEYQFDCFEDDALDRDWSADPFYQTTLMLREELDDFTFRVRARNAQGGVTQWSQWKWITELPEL